MKKTYITIGDRKQILIGQCSISDVRHFRRLYHVDDAVPGPVVLHVDSAQPHRRLQRERLLRRRQLQQLQREY